MTIVEQLESLIGKECYIKIKPDRVNDIGAQYHNGEKFLAYVKTPISVDRERNEVRLDQDKDGFSTRIFDIDAIEIVRALDKESSIKGEKSEK